MSGPRPPTRRDFAMLAFIVLLGASLRLLWIHTPLLEAHRWRQVDTAGITRSLYEDRFNVFYPQVNWGGREGYVESEFPLMPAITAVLWKIFGPEDYLGRVVSMVFSTATIVSTFWLASELLGATAGLAAAFLFAVSPAAVFFGRTFMPDSMMLFFWVSGIVGFVRYFRTGSPRALRFGSVAAALACLVKLPALMMMAPIAGAAWNAKGFGAMRDRRFMIAIVAPLVVTVAWYWHAFNLYEQTGLTFGILVHPARTYPLSIAPGPWNYAFSKWSKLDVLLSRDYYMTLLARLHQILMPSWGFAGALLGAVVWKWRDGRIVADLWLAAMIAFVLVMGEANIGHEYYQLPIVPLGALYFGAFAGPALEQYWSGDVADVGSGFSPSGDVGSGFSRIDKGDVGSGFSRIDKGVGLVRGIVLALVLAVVGGVGFYYSGIINSHFRPDSPDVRVVQAGQAVAQVVPGDALLIVADDYGSTSPLLLYFAHRKGWSFDVENLFPQMIDGLRQKGARYFVSTVWSRVQHERPDAAAYLQFFKKMELHGEPPDTVVFELVRRDK